MILFLLGYMGCGKSTYGKLLSNKIENTLYNFSQNINLPFVFITHIHFHDLFTWFNTFLIFWVSFVRSISVMVGRRTKITDAGLSALDNLYRLRFFIILGW